MSVIAHEVQEHILMVALEERQLTERIGFQLQQQVHHLAGAWPTVNIITEIHQPIFALQAQSSQQSLQLLRAGMDITDNKATRRHLGSSLRLYT